MAAGSRATAEAGAEVLRAGGGAVDAVVAAGLAATVAEPGLASLGGGGFLLAAPPGAAPEVLDFFVDAPGRGRPAERLLPSFVPVVLRFTGAEQLFHAGWGSVAVPGALDGLVAAHQRHGRLPLADVVAPSARLARDGVVLEPAQAGVVALLAEILTLTPPGAALFAPGGRLLQAGDRLRDPELADLLDEVGAGRVRRWADLAGAVAEAADRAGAPLSGDDLHAYEVRVREPLHRRVPGGDVATNPPPSFGGSLVLDALAALPRPVPVPALVDALVDMSERHVRGAVRGTTHVSAADADGGLAALTMSNGSCAGVYVPGTGVQLNNVMGEADLHPEGFSATPPGTRVGSMMAPTLLTADDGSRTALGSGGSERIRSALLCVLTGLLDAGLPLEDAVRAPRLHWDRTALQVEPGAPEVPPGRPVRRWAQRDFYFGGVQAVRVRSDGLVEAAADDRRGGAAVVV